MGQFIKRYILCCFSIFILAGCGMTDKTSQAELLSQNTISDDAVSENVSENAQVEETEENMRIIEISEGLYAYFTPDLGRYADAIEGISEWIVIQNKNPEEITVVEIYDNWDLFDMRRDVRGLYIPNLYGTVTDITLEEHDWLEIHYMDAEGMEAVSVLPLHFYPKEDGVVTNYWGIKEVWFLYPNEEELLNNTPEPIEVWQEILTVGEQDYTVTFSRISPMYGAPYSDFTWAFGADYMLSVCKGDQIIYEKILYEYNVGYEEVHFVEDVNGDGREDLILLDDSGVYKEEATPYFFIWDTEREGFIYNDAIITENNTVYGDEEETYKYYCVNYDRETGTFYGSHVLLWGERYERDMHGKVILFGARFYEGAWQTVYELYLSEEDEHYVREIRYDNEGNVISDITIDCPDYEYTTFTSPIYDSIDIELVYPGLLGYEIEEIVVINCNYSYYKYVPVEE